jgi:hypothetical protein
MLLFSLGGGTPTKRQDVCLLRLSPDDFDDSAGCVTAISLPFFAGAFNKRTLGMKRARRMAFVLA